jgi:tetratricopeptide (TPR) repeat protein
MIQNKERGTSEILDASNYEQALVYLTKVLYVREYVFTENEKDEKRVNEIVFSTLLNLNLCCLKLKRYKDAILYGKRALEIEKSVKAHYRCALAYFEDNNLSEASIELSNACLIDPSNTEVLSLQRKIQISQENAKKAELNFASNIFK